MIVTQLEMLTDEEFKYLLSEPDFIEGLLYVIREGAKHYSQYDKQLGSRKDKNSILVRKNLPGIALKLFKERDKNIVSIIQHLSEGIVSVFCSEAEKYFGEELNKIDFEKLSPNEFVDFMVESEEDNTNIDFKLLVIQMKLCNIFYDEEKINKIEEIWNSKHLTEEEINFQEESAEENTEKEIVVEKKKITSKATKKTSAAEKEAKRKAAESAKKKASKAEEEVLEESEPLEEKTEIIDEKASKPEPEKIVIEETHYLEERKMHAYVGTVNASNTSGYLTFYNFNPIGELNGRQYRSFMDYELSEIFPESFYRNILLFYTSTPDQIDFVNANLKDGMLLILEYEVEEMEANISPNGERNNTGYKVRVVEGFKNKKIRPLWEDGFYSLLPSDVLAEEIGARNFIRIEDGEAEEGERYLVGVDNDYCVGPYEAKYKATQYSHVIEPGAKDKKYLLDGYAFSDLRKVCFERTFSRGPLGAFRLFLYEIPSDTKPHKIDVITDKILLESLGDEIRRQGKNTVDISELPGLVKNINQSVLFGDGVPEEITKARFERLSSLLMKVSNEENTYEDILNIICGVFENNKDTEKVNELVRDLFRNESFAENIQSVKFLREQIEQLKGEKNVLKDEKREAESETIKQKEELQLTEEFKQKKDELEKISAQISQLKEESKDFESMEKLREEVAYLEKHKTYLSKDVKELEVSFSQMINDSSSKMADITFDGYVSSKMMEAASSWDEKRRTKDHERIVDAMNESDIATFSRDELVDYIVSLIQKERPHYTRNMIINLMICTMQGMLTVFAGSPGCGKTSICNIIATVLGTRSFSSVNIDGVMLKPNRFVQVSVERGWTSKRDFIGYYNPLTKTFEENNREVFDGLKILNTEARKGISKLPFMILLDEANLSPMEYYWADFMNVCDDLENNHSVNLGNNNIFEIPDTLHFVATINNDHTTETLSPRLIDRAWIVTLPQERSYLPGKAILDAEVNRLSWESLKETFVDVDDSDILFSRDVQSVYDELKKILSEMGLSISIRTDKAIKKYCAVAKELMDDDEVGTSSEIIALDFAISQKVLPKISGNGEDYEKWLIKLREFSKEKYLNNTSLILNRILETGKRQMKFYQFFN